MKEEMKQNIILIIAALIMGGSITFIILSFMKALGEF